MSKNDGDAAFPRPYSRDSGNDSQAPTADEQTGMTLRDYFAGKVVGQLVEEYIKPVATGSYSSGPRDNWTRYVAHDAYKIADEMLKERDR